MVVKDVGDNVVVAGIPAKVIRTINMEEKKFLLKGEIRDFGEDSIGASRPLN